MSFRQGFNPQRSKNWIYRWSNPDPYYFDNPLFADAKYSVHQVEKAASGLIHLQGYIEFKNQKQFKTLKKNYPEIHWEVRKGTQQQARDYCMKEDTRASPEIIEDYTVKYYLFKMQGSKYHSEHAISYGPLLTKEDLLSYIKENE